MTHHEKIELINSSFYAICYCNKCTTKEYKNIAVSACVFATMRGKDLL